MSREVVSGIPINGKKFEARVHKISNSGNGMVETTESEINLGPVESNAVGERIEAMKLPGPFARIKRPKKILKPNYIESLQKITPYDFSIDYGDAHSNISKHGMRKQENIGAILEYVPDDDISNSEQRVSRSNGQTQAKEDTLYYGRINRIDKSGNGLVQIGDESISIGPIREDAVGYEVAVIPIRDGVGVCKTLSVRKEDYFKRHINNINTDLIDTLNHFEVGMTVWDRQEEFVQGGIVVNLPPIPAKDYVLYHDGEKEVTVSDENPECDRLVSVVVIVTEETLQDHFPEYDGDTIPLKTLAEQRIEHYVYPPERLRPMEDDIPDHDGLKISEVSTERFSDSAPGITASEPDDVLADQDSSYKYKTNQTRPRAAPSPESNENESDKGRIDTSSVDTEEIEEPESDEQKKHSQETGETSRSSEGESIRPISDSSESEIEEVTDDLLREDNNTPVTGSSAVDSEDTLTEETPEDDIKEDTNEDSQREPNLNELREKAKEDEVEEVPETVSTTTEKTQYHRSPAIKEYVKTRADGYCEGCGEPAPFTSTTGDPYLHAHHVHELSEGGSDTVDTVIALCPNCHYRVHHGRDGKEYNQKLLEKVQRLESS